MEEEVVKLKAEAAPHQHLSPSHTRSSVEKGRLGSAFFAANHSRALPDCMHSRSAKNARRSTLGLCFPKFGGRCC